MEAVLEAIFDIFFSLGGGRGRRRRRPSLLALLGPALAVVMVGLGILTGLLLARRVPEVGPSTFALLLIPFGGTALAGMAGEARPVQWLAAATVSTLLAVALSLPLHLAILVGGVAH